MEALAELSEEVEKPKVVYVEDPEKHLGLVWHIVQSKFKVPNPAVTSSEEYSDGLLGLLNACRKFNHSLDLQFSTYAYKCIIHSILSGRKRQRRFNERYSTSHQIEINSKEDHREDLKVEIDYQSCSEWLNLQIDSLSIRSQQILQLRRQGLTLKEVGERIGLTKERIRQIQDEAVKSLQHRINTESQPECIGV